MIKANSLYQDVLAVTTDYLGPAARRFVDRQIDSHLSKAPEELTKSDLKTLAAWSRVSMALLTNDKQIVNNYVNRLMSLANNGTT